MNVPITSGVGTFAGLAFLALVVLLGVAIALGAARSVKVVNLRPAIITGWVMSLAVLCVLIASGAGLVNDELVWHGLGVSAAESLTGVTDHVVSYVDGKEGYIWIVGVIYAVTGPVPLIPIVVNFILQSLLIVSVSRSTELLALSFSRLGMRGTRRAVRLAAYSGALLPSISLWVPKLLRETASLFLISVSVLLFIQLLRTRKGRYFFAAAAALACLSWIRGPVGLALSFALVIASLAVWFRSPRYQGLVRLALVPPVLVAAFVSLQFAGSKFGLSPEEVALRNRELSAIASSGYSGVTAGSDGYSTILTVNLPRSLFGPFVWEWDTSAAMILAAVEGTIWVVTLVLALRGVLTLRRDKPAISGQSADDGRLALVVLIATMAILATITVSVANYGLLARLRPMAFIVLLPLACLAFVQLRESAQLKRALKGRSSLSRRTDSRTGIDS